MCWHRSIAKTPLSLLLLPQRQTHTLHQMWAQFCHSLTACCVKSILYSKPKAVHFWCTLMHCKHLHPSASTLKPQIAEINNLDHAATLQYSAVYCWIMAFIQMPTDPKDLPKHPCRVSKPLKAAARPDDTDPPQQDSVGCHTTKPAQEQPQECDKEIKILTWPQNAPDPNLNEPHGDLYKTLQSMGLC